jgi:indolepyruvate ferredoxin oxidoreductase
MAATLADVTLDDRYDLARSRVLMNGTQALIRLTLEQAALDRAAGLDTAGYVTGYRGSPLGGVDSAFGAARNIVEPAGIRFQAGVNEDLAATAIIGTQQIALNGQARKDGVFALWYGKGPGVDRSGDPFHHGNAYGSAAHGGVLLAAGDDHLAKSSTTAHQSEYALMHALIPVLHPATLEEIVAFGLAGWAMSRFSGCWVGLKLVTDLVDSSGTVDLTTVPRSFVRPEFDIPPGGLNIRAPDTPQEQERRLHAFKLPAAQASARANGLDRITHDATEVRLGIVTTGKSWRDTCQALADLGIGEAERRTLGIVIYKVGLVWPLEPAGLLEFASRAEELLVIEEKRPLIEDQLRSLLYDSPVRPALHGKRGGDMAHLLPSHGDLGALDIARAISARILPHVEDRRLLDRIAALSSIDADKLASLSPVRRTPYFCSGCPHNSSTVVPEGSRAIAGIGCHGMVQMMDRATDVFVQMGGEGANWIGQAPFVEAPHVFQNLGDGTYFHSGLLAIRAAVAAGVNITYKLLYNDAVAMTGGQPHDGQLTPQDMSRQLRAEGLQRIAIVSDDIHKYRGQPPFVEGATIHDRRDLEAVQRELRDTSGVTALIYDQVCATEKRRRRKRGKMPPAERRVLINDLVCEGCGDCSVKSNCLSVVPLETEFGRKRAIDQSSCNQDLSCVNGFCPSFVTVTGAVPRRGRAADPSAFDDVELPDPLIAGSTADIMVTGIGGTGVVTIGAVLAMAAHLEGKSARTLDQTGLAQKGGQVITHLKIADAPIASEKLSPASATLLLGADLVSSASKEVLLTLKPGSRAILNGEETMTGVFVRQPDFRIESARLRKIVAGIAGAEHVEAVEATAIARRLLGDAIGANMILVGFAWQRGSLPLGEAAILKALELNGTAVAMNKAAFRIGRMLAARPDALGALEPGAASTDRGQLRLSVDLDEQIERRIAFLTSYQNSDYAAQYSAFVERVRAREQAAIGREGALSEAVGRGLFKLMAYKDEYEVARLYGGAAFQEQLDRTFEKIERIEFHLAPPLLARRDKVTGEPRKIRFGPWMRGAYRMLARLRGLRGTPFDIFGYTHERRTERALIAEYRAMVERDIETLTPATFARAVKRAAAAERIRGYGHVKQRNLTQVRKEWAEPAADAESLAAAA